MLLAFCMHERDAETALSEGVEWRTKCAFNGVKKSMCYHTGGWRSIIEAWVLEGMA